MAGWTIQRCASVPWPLFARRPRRLASRCWPIWIPRFPAAAARSRSWRTCALPLGLPACPAPESASRRAARSECTLRKTPISTGSRPPRPAWRSPCAMKWSGSTGQTRHARCPVGWSSRDRWRSAWRRICTCASPAGCWSGLARSRRVTLLPCAGNWRNCRGRDFSPAIGRYGWMCRPAIVASITPRLWPKRWS